MKNTATALKPPKLLSELSLGESALVLGFTDPALEKRLLSMGVLPSSVIKVINTTLYKSSFHIQSNNFSLAIRKKEAQCIQIRPIS